MKRGNIVWGALLIIIGVLVLANNILGYEILSMSNLWPLIILGFGLWFEVNFFTRNSPPGVLVPGGILTTIGLLFLFESFTGWRFAEYTWPVYQLAVAIGLFQLYLFGGRRKGVLLAVAILTVIPLYEFGVMMFGNFLSKESYNIFIAVGIIAIGLYLLFKNKNPGMG